MAEVVMPRLDPGMQSGKIVEWLKKEGVIVQKGEPILVVEGEKTTFEIEAPETGVLSKILVEVGTDVQVAQPVAIIGESSHSPRTAQAEEARDETLPKQSRSEPAPLLTRGAGIPDRVIASPAARKLALDHHLDLSALTGSGPGGRITREDVLAAVQLVPKSAPTVSKATHAAVLRKVKLEGIRKAVAERLSFSARTAVPVTITTEADATSLIALKDRESHIGFTALAVKAAAKALETHLAINSTIEGDEITTYSDINVAVAINTEEGLVAPVIPHANKKSLKEISATIDDLSQRAREKRLTLENLTGGTFTVTNLGAYDVESFAPIINPPQCAILGLGRIGYKPSTQGRELSQRPSTLLTLVFDHRIVDGVPAAKFLRELKRNLEDPESLM